MAILGHEAADGLFLFGRQVAEGRAGLVAMEHGKGVIGV